MENETPKVPLPTTLGSIIRHVASAGGAILASHGFIGDSDVEGTVGVVMFIAGLVWSYIQKRTVEKAKIEAVKKNA